MTPTHTHVKTVLDEHGVFLYRWLNPGGSPAGLSTEAKVAVEALTARNRQTVYAACSDLRQGDAAWEYESPHYDKGLRTLGPAEADAVLSRLNAPDPAMAFRDTFRQTPAQEAAKLKLALVAAARAFLQEIER